MLFATVEEEIRKYRFVPYDDDECELYANEDEDVVLDTYDYITRKGWCS